MTVDDWQVSGERAYTRGERYAVLVSALGGYWLDFYNILVISFLMTPIQEDLHISLGQAGAITSVTLAASVVGGILFGYIADHYGRKNALMWSILLFSVGAILSGISWNYASLLAFRAIAGVGIGGEWGVGMTLYNEVWKPKRRGLGSALIQSMALLGIAASVVVAKWSLGAFAGSWGWRAALFLGATPLLFLVFVRRYMPESNLWHDYQGLRQRGELPAEKAKQKVSLIEIFRGTSLRFTIVGLLILCGYMFGFYGVATYMPTYMAKDLGGAQGVETATLISSLIAIPCFWIIGWLSDLYGRRRTLLALVVVTLGGYAGIYYASPLGLYHGSAWSWPITWWYLLWTIGVGSACVFGPWLAELFPVETRSTATSTIYMCGRTMSAAAPPAVAAIAAATGSLVTGMTVVGIAMIVMGVAALALPETAGRAFKVIESKRAALSEGKPDDPRMPSTSTM